MSKAIGGAGRSLRIGGPLLLLLIPLSLWGLAVGKNSGASVEPETRAPVTADAGAPGDADERAPENGSDPGGPPPEPTRSAPSVEVAALATEGTTTPGDDAVAVASATPLGFQLVEDTGVGSREEGSSVAHIQRFVRGELEEYSDLASIKIWTIDWPYDHAAEMARYEGAEAVTMGEKDAVLYYTVPEEPAEGLTVLRWGLGDSRLVMVTARGAVTLDEVLSVAGSVVLEEGP